MMLILSGVQWRMKKRWRKAEAEVHAQVSFSALTVLVQWQEEHQANNKTRSIGTVHNSAKARLTSAGIRIRIRDMDRQ